MINYGDIDSYSKQNRALKHLNDTKIKKLIGIMKADRGSLDPPVGSLGGLAPPWVRTPSMTR